MGLEAARLGGILGRKAPLTGEPRCACYPPTLGLIPALSMPGDGGRRGTLCKSTQLKG